MRVSLTKRLPTWSQLKSLSHIKWLPALAAYRICLPSLLFHPLTPTFSLIYLPLCLSYVRNKIISQGQVRLSLTHLMTAQRLKKVLEGGLNCRRQYQRRPCVVTCLIRGVADGIPNGSHAWKQRKDCQKGWGAENRAEKMLETVMAKKGKKEKRQAKRKENESVKVRA